MIEAAVASGTVRTRNWDREPLPPFLQPQPQPQKDLSNGKKRGREGLSAEPHTAVIVLLHVGVPGLRP